MHAFTISSSVPLRATYLWLDATWLKVREGGRVVSVAAIIAMAVNREGRREIVGLHMGPNESETFWSEFLRQLLRRGLSGVQLVVSDAHEGLKAAISKLPGVTWQRCRVHWLWQPWPDMTSAHVTEHFAANVRGIAATSHPAIC